MIIESQSRASHKKMPGRRISHPSSTNYDEDFESPVAKRLKRLDSTDSSLSRQLSDEEEEGDERETSPRIQVRREIADSEAESDDEGFLPSASQPTELENSLPPMRTDKEAIAEYEASRAAKPESELDLQGRLGQRKWIRGKSSIYVDAFNLALETVLEDESHLFDEAEIAVFKQWRTLSYEGQYLYVVLIDHSSNLIHYIKRGLSISVDTCVFSFVKLQLGIESIAWDTMVILQICQQQLKRC